MAKRNREPQPQTPSSKTAKNIAGRTSSVSLTTDDQSNLDWLVRNDPAVSGLTDALRVGMQARRNQLEKRVEDERIENIIAKKLDQSLSLLAARDRFHKIRKHVKEHISADPLDHGPTTQADRFVVESFVALTSLLGVYRYCGVPDYSSKLTYEDAEAVFDYWDEYDAWRTTGSEGPPPSVKKIYTGEWLLLVCNLNLVNADADFLNVRVELRTTLDLLIDLLSHIETSGQDVIYATYFMRAYTMLIHVLGLVETHDLPTHEHFCCNAIILNTINGLKPPGSDC